MNRLTPLLLAILAVLLLNGCAVSTRPITHLQLSAGDGPDAGTDDPVIVVDAIRLPDFLLRDELLVRLDSYSLRYDPYQRWAEPLDLGIQRVISRHLRELLNTRQVVRFPDVARRAPDWELRVEIDHFEVIDGRATLIGLGQWTDPSDPSSVVATIEFEESATPPSLDGGAVAAALSDLLRMFSAALAEPIIDAQPTTNP